MAKSISLRARNNNVETGGKRHGTRQPFFSPSSFLQDRWGKNDFFPGKFNGVSKKEGGIADHATHQDPGLSNKKQSGNHSIQRMCSECREEQKIQRSAEADSMHVSPGTEDNIAKLAGKGNPLPETTLGRNVVIIRK